MKVGLKYLASDDKLAAYVASTAGGPAAEHPGDYVIESVEMNDARAQLVPPTLDREGFTLRSHKHTVSDFYNDDELKSRYEDEVRALVCAVTNASRVEVFDHTRRSSSEGVRKQKVTREHASVIHNDYTDKSGPKRLGELMPDEAEALSKRRFSIVNVWRSIHGTIDNFPLAMCDAASVAPQDLIAVPRRSNDRVGEIQLAKHNPTHRWLYFPTMTENEVLLFKTYDSLAEGVARFTIHSAFDDPTAPKNARPRESIETRCFVFY